MPPGERSPTSRLAQDTVAILDYLQRNQYARIEHLVFAGLWETGMLLGGVRAPEVDDERFASLGEEIAREHDEPFGDGLASEQRPDDEGE